jgi:hypothetical protein
LLRAVAARKTAAPPQSRCCIAEGNAVIHALHSKSEATKSHYTDLVMPAKYVVFDRMSFYPSSRMRVFDLAIRRLQVISEFEEGIDKLLSCLFHF